MSIDKVYHVIAGAIISSTCIFLLHTSALVAIIVTALVGAAKELYDHYYNGTVEAMDEMATIAGGSIPIAILEVTKWL